MQTKSDKMKKALNSYVYVLTAYDWQENKLLRTVRCSCAYNNGPVMLTLLRYTCPTT